VTGTAGDENTPAPIRVFGSDAETDECAGYVFPAIPQFTNGIGRAGPPDTAALSVGPPVYLSAGKSTTSRMVRRPVSSITKRSMPMPIPPVGGMPCSRARM
jgi:hypothetical protein